MNPPDDFAPPVGVAETLEPGLRRIVAPNPSPMTYRGTNTYLLGDRDIVVIDPGPEIFTHLDAILNSLQSDQRISHILVTHAHVDHSPLSRALALESGAPVLAYGPASRGQSAVMRALSATDSIGGGEGIDESFQPDRQLENGEILTIAGQQIEVLHTPGHIGNHICLAWQGACFTADHVMGWASSLVSPPDGDLTDFMTSCAILRERPWRTFYPGHGAQIDNPAERLDWLIAHRKGREAEILKGLRHGPATAQALAQKIYTQVPTALLGAATRNVLAHLIDLTGKSVVSHKEKLSANTVFYLL